MNIDPTSSTAAETPQNVFTPGGDLGKDEFLTLLVAQLTNQDPLNPMEGSDLAVQLAQFSSVEQLIQLNENLQGQFDLNGQITQALNSSIGTGLIGKEVLALGDAISISSTGSADVTFRVAEGGAAELKVLDAEGTVVSSTSLGSIGPGRHDETLDLSDVPADGGPYRYVVEISDAEGNVTNAETFSRGAVRGVRFEGGRPVLLIGDREVAMEDVIEVG